VGSLCIPELAALFENPPHSVVPQPLPCLHYGTGRNERTVSRQQNIKAINDGVKRFLALKGHADETPDHHICSESALAERDCASFLKAAADERRVKNIRERIQRITKRIVTRDDIKGLTELHKKIRKRSVSGFLHSHWIVQLILN
jgi:hypothetical protein